jgi:hypothetical protein
MSQDVSPSKIDFHAGLRAGILHTIPRGLPFRFFDLQVFSVRIGRLGIRRVSYVVA